jgi:DNA polymerase-3 subunit delta'
MTNFYIAEILNLTAAAGLIGQSQLKLNDIKEMVLEHLDQKSKVDKVFQNHNIFWYNSELTNFKIDLARQIIKETQYADWHQQGVRVLVLLNFESAGLAAQNALLKLIEEPPVNTLIILPVGSDHHLLPTISSRCSICHSLSQASNEQALEEKAFNFPQNLSQAIELIAQYKDRESAITLIKNLLKQEQLTHQQKKSLSQAYLDLKENLNVRLALEHCFFSVLGKKI